MITIPDFNRSPYPYFLIGALTLGFILGNVFMKLRGINKLTRFYITFITLVAVLSFTFSYTAKGGMDLRSLSFDGIFGGAGFLCGIFASACIFKDDNISILTSWIGVAPLMYSISKIGCLLAGCCRGFCYDGPMDLIYHNSGTTGYFPVQIVESLCFLIVFLLWFLLFLKRKDSFKSIFLIIYLSVAIRFVTDFFRLSHQDKILSGTQLILLFGVSIVIIVNILIIKKWIRSKDYGRK